MALGIEARRTARRTLGYGLQSTVSVFAVLAALVAGTPAIAQEPEAAPPSGSSPQRNATDQSLPTVQVEAPRQRPARPARRAVSQPRRATSAPRPVAAVPQPQSQSGSGAGTEQVRSDSASEFVLRPDRLSAYPVSRPGELLEMAPGLVITQHSGEGKANQYFLRGFNLDHGTDLAISIDGMPVNMRTHGHGQGWADVNFLIPELVGAMRIRKGPYFADEGDFSSAGALSLDLIDTQSTGLIQGTIGSFGYGRALAIKSMPAWAGNLLVAVEANAYDGPWDEPDGVRKLNGVLRYSQGTADEGFSITGMAYRNSWRSTDQIPQRAVDEGVIGEFGSMDPTDGGKSNRFSLSTRIAHTSEYGVSKLDAYIIRSDLTLWNNFTYFLDNEKDGDQFSQLDNRTVMGFHGSHTFKGQVGDMDSQLKVGIQGRFDDIDVGLLKTKERMTLSTVRRDHVQENSVGIYGEHTLAWTRWLRTIVGARVDHFWADVDSDNPANSGNSEASIASPKFGIVLGPFDKTEFFFNAGTGFHSNDVRGTTITVDPSTGEPADKVPLLVRATGAEVGVRTKVIDGLESSVAVFYLKYASELLFVGDAGTTEPSRPSERVGVEWTNHYQPYSWLGFDLDVAYTHARFSDFDPAGDFIPGAPAWVVTGGFVVGGKTGWFGGAKVRYFGPRPLIEDASVSSDPTTIVNARIGYRFENGVRVQLDALNLFNTKAHQIDYYYDSRLPGEPVEGVGDTHFHPAEPLAVRLTVAGQF